jgi:hypothetical protein
MGRKRRDMGPYADQLRQYGTSAAYLVSKLKRDRPDVAARMAAGEFKSVSQGLRAAGMLPPIPTAGEKLRQRWNKLSLDEQDRFLCEVLECTTAELWAFAVAGSIPDVDGLAAQARALMTENDPDAIRAGLTELAEALERLGGSG